MAKKTKLIDTNFIIRFLTQDDPQSAKKVEKIFQQAGKHELEIPDFILTEIVWVLISYYHLSKEEVIEKLEGVLSFEKFKLNRKVFRVAIGIYREHNISFVDAYLCALSGIKNSAIYSFDKRLKKVNLAKISDL